MNIRESEEFVGWMSGLDSQVKIRVLSRLERIRLGNFGDHKRIDQGLFELRFTYGGGIRIYYTQLDSGEVVLLLVGGDKSSQQRDIEKAKEMLSDL